MKTVHMEPNYPAWRDAARELLAAGMAPDEILWEDGTFGAGSLFESMAGEFEQTEGQCGGMGGRSGQSGSVRISREFLSLAELVACHSESERWALLYRVAWRLTRGGEKGLLKRETDSDVMRLRDWSSAVRRCRHKMKAFVRFRKVGEREAAEVNERGEGDGEKTPSGRVREQFVAWFEPEYRIVELTAPFFARRFAAMDWSILTPSQCAHWDGDSLSFTAGVRRDEAPESDALEDYWRSYYAHIFNPARLKLKAMQSEMPKKYWSNLPEATLISELTRQSSLRTSRMVDAPSSERSHVSDRVPMGVPAPETSPELAPEPNAPLEVLGRSHELTLTQIKELGLQCRSCPLHERATGVVFGEGPAGAEIMIVGEQPGDAEDLQGRPFVGPAGRLLDMGLGQAGLDRDELYITNVVKHFKWKRHGKRRMHQAPAADEIHVCRPWLLAEIAKLAPRTIVCLGATAAKALIRPDFALLAERGTVMESPLAERVVATVHPSYLLRLPEGRDRDAEIAHWIDDLKLAGT